VDYAVVSKVVPGVEINGAGSPPVNATTNSLGDYTLTGFGTGAYTITPTRTAQPCPGGPPNGIFADDASLVSQYVVGLTILSPDQVIAGTVNSLNLPISSLDAAFIAQRAVGLCNANSRTGQWIFAPPSVSHPGGVTGQLVENYRAYLIGDVSGDWDPLGPTRPGENNISGDLVKATISSARASSGSQVLIPLRIDQLRDRTVNSLQFDIHYDPAIITPAEPGATLEGAVDASLSVISNSPEPGLLKVAVYGAFPVGGDGVYAYLIFNVTGPADSASDIKISGFRFNDGSEPAAVKDGRLTIHSAVSQSDPSGRWLMAYVGWPIS
jgi:hypothetical protein